MNFAFNYYVVFSIFFGCDENISKNGRRQRRQMMSEVDRRPLEKLSLVDVDHEKLSLVDVDKSSVWSMSTEKSAVVSMLTVDSQGL